MNKVIMTNAYIGKNGIDLKFTAGDGKAVANFSIAVKKDFKEKEYNYFNCVLWGKQAEWISNNQDRINKIGLEGRLETRSYDAKDGTKKYVTEIVCNHVEVEEWKTGSIENVDFGVPIESDITPVNDNSDIPF
ncbi:single-stranded DNA-binding protein [Clostridium felsineum]|uniref:single-stranded DNA-binding protein n=1 Tax=Clostridium felsineum TaxID=36839 RepID=UPI00214D246C|nr:single-stranded DNA-binding protein [Clostridium felsineum]MCR3759180.1 single-stranded DNA-binding protein [Clostridium felsineum]